MADFQYTTLSESDRLLLARDTLRARESDHYRISLLDEPNKEARLADMETEITALRETVAAQEAAVQSESDAQAADDAKAAKSSK